MTKKRNDLFELIFSDAQIIDFDFYKWDKYIRLCVVGIDVDYPVANRLPLFTVDFIRVSYLSCSFNHYNVKLENKNHHFQWNIHDYKIEKKNNSLHIELIGSGFSPKIKIICDNYIIEPLSHSVLDKLFPDWEKPYSPLSRPSIDSIYRAFLKKKK